MTIKVAVLGSKGRMGAEVVKAVSNASDLELVASIDQIKENDYNLNIPLYVEKIIEDNLPSVEVALADLKTAWEESLNAEENFKNILNQFI